MISSAAGPVGAAGRTILIVDDEPDVVAYLTTLLEDNGYQTLAAKDGKEAVELARTQKPALISLDISMPEESGVKAYRELQDGADTKDIPVIIVTGISADFERFIRSRKQVDPPDAYFEKPIDPEKFLEKVAELVK